jgi:hypothetical protein
MGIHKEPVPRALKAVGKLLDRYTTSNGKFITPVRLLGKNGLAHVIGRQRGIHIDIQCMPWDPQAVHACVFRFGTPGKVERAEIYLPTRLDLGWARFAIANELAHLLLDSADDFSGNPVATAQSLIDSPLFARNGGGDPEYMYHVAAMEMLIPWRRRNLLPIYHWGFFDADRKRAEYFGVPEKLIHQRTRRATKRMLKRGYADLR